MGIDFAKHMLGKEDDKIRHLHDYIKMVVNQNLPVSLCETDAFRALNKEHPHLSYSSVRKTILRLKIIVKKRIAQRLRMANVGGIMFDSWGRYNVHYCGVIANIVGPTGEVESHLMSCFPLTGGKVVNPDDVTVRNSSGDGLEVVESIKFCAENYVTSIETLFDDFELDIDDWLTHISSDNASVMRRVAKLLKKPFVGCKNHQLDLTVSRALPLDITQEKLQNHPNKKIIETMLSCQETMKNAKMQAKAGAVLRSLTSLKAHVAVGNR